MTDWQKLNLAHAGMIVSLFAVVLAVVTAYVWAPEQQLVLQGVAHLSTLLFAVTLKLSYILRLHALHRLNRPVN